jgi:hypothetical protein
MADSLDAVEIWSMCQENTEVRPTLFLRQNPKKPSAFVVLPAPPMRQMSNSKRRIHVPPEGEQNEDYSLESHPLVRFISDGVRDPIPDHSDDPST